MELGFAQDYRTRRLARYERVTNWLDRHETVGHAAMALVMALLTGLLAQISIQTPLTPVPFTMQVFGIALTAGLLGRKWGTISALFYIGLGVIGLPIFAGEMAAFDGWDFFRFSLFTTGLTSWYLVGFVVQAYLVGAVLESGRERRHNTLVLFAPIAIAGCIVFALLDVYYLSDYGALYRQSAFPNVWFGLLALGILLVLASFAWLAFTRTARRERIELFFANVVGLLAVYAMGAIGLWAIWNATLGDRLGPLDARGALAYGVLPFIPVDLAKILLAVGVLTLLRPTQRELASQSVV